MINRDSAYRRGTDGIAPDVIDRILLGACAAIWLVLLGVSVAAAVALVDLGRGFHRAAAPPQTPWVLYAVIAASALTIAVAIPVLLRARGMARGGPADRSPTAPASVVDWLTPRPNDPAAPTERLRPQGSATDWPGPAADRVWLRGFVLLLGTMGVALICVAAATYLMAIAHDAASWVCYVLAGIVTAVMPVIEWLHVRRLRQLRHVSA